jgi:SAM-dependent methyltransferase
MGASAGLFDEETFRFGHRDMSGVSIRLVRCLDRKLDFIADIPDEGRVLDIGCGMAPYSGYFRRFRPDIELDIQDLSQSLGNKVREFHVCDIASDPLPFRNGFFDGVYSSHVIEHLGNYGNIEKFIKESFRGLGPGGNGYIETPSIRSLKMPSLSIFPWEKSGPINFYDDPTHNLFVDRQEMSDVLMRNNFIIKRAGIYRNWMIASMIIPLPALAFFIPRRYTAATIKHVVGWSQYWIVEKSKA